MLTSERFDHLGFLIQFGEGITLSQAAPFYTNLEPDMPVVSVPVAAVHEWVLQQICLALENNADKAKGNDPSTELDVDTGDACVNQSMSESSSSPNGSFSLSYAAKSRCQTFIEGISKASVVKQSTDIKGHSVKVIAIFEHLNNRTKLIIMQPDGISQNHLSLLRVEIHSC